MKKALLGLLALVLLFVGGGFAFLTFARPLAQPASAERIEATPERLARGEYLTRHVADCLSCHSEFDTGTYGVPPKPGTEGAGGLCFNKENVGFPGQVCAQNITPDGETGIGEWTDGEIMRAIREGISRDGRALLPMMPYKIFRNLSDEDTRAIVAYLRTLPAIKKETPASQLDFPVNLFVRLEPQPLTEPVPEPDRSNRLAYGKYLAWACYDCHTQVDDKMKPIESMAFAGGRLFDVMGMAVRTPNLTPHQTGLGDRNEEMFVGMFKAWESGQRVPVKWEHNTLMPWLSYAKLKEEDLRAIYTYLRSLPPIDNKVDRRPPSKTAAAAASTRLAPSP